MDAVVDLSILLLARKEAVNLGILIPKMKPVLNSLAVKYEIVVVDADSDDRTERLCRENGILYVVQSRPGFGAALVQGFRACSGRRILTMDADLQHDPRTIPELLGRDADIVIGSRWIGGSHVRLSLPRRALSLVVNAVFSKCIGASIKDTSSNYRVYARSAIQNIEIEARDFDALQEILAKCIRRGYSIVEVPIHFGERRIGHSNVSLPVFFPSYSRTLIKLIRIRLTYPHRRRVTATPERDLPPNPR